MKIATHNSTYHADDVFAVATLLLVEPDAEIIRTRDKKEIEGADYVVDVGYEYDPIKRRFDHHQPGGAGARVSGIQYGSFGLVWKEYGESLAGGIKEAEIIDKLLAEPLDANDNGMAIADYKYDDIHHYTLVDFVYSFLPTSYETDENLYKIFVEVVDIAKSLLKREIAKAKFCVFSEEQVRKIYEESEDKRIIVLDKQYDWGSVLMNTSDTIYAVYPRNDGHWSVKAVRVSKKTYGLNRKSFPESWGGKIDEELQRITGVEDAIFAHRGLFMAAAKTKEGAIKLAQLALKA